MPTDPVVRPASPPTRTPAVHWDVRLPMRDGVELSANIWRPVDADAEPVPAILELIPYGKDNWRRNADTGRGEWFAARGYALVRVDVRGTGIIGRPRARRVQRGRDRGWCRGRDLACCPAVVHGRGRDVGHQLRGVHRDPGRQAPATGAQGHRPVPGDRRSVSDRRAPHRRLRHRERALAIRREPGGHERDATRRGVPRGGVARRVADAARRHAAVAGRVASPADRRPVLAARSLAPDYDSIEAAILNVGGWCDAYVDAALRMQARCAAPSRTIVGNWVHGWPHDSPPGPNLDELHEVVRFFDRWLKGE